MRTSYPLGLLVRAIAPWIAAGLMALFDAAILHAEDGLYRGRDGLTGRIVDLGVGIHLYSDTHGTRATVLERRGAGPGEPLRLPGGRVELGTRTPFGNSVPPSSLTLAPLLPIVPHGPLMPASPVPLPIISPFPGLHGGSLSPGGR